MKRYETELVPISKANRVARILVSSVCCLAGLALFRDAVNDATARGAYFAWGVVVLGAGCFFLWLSITRKYDTRLTKAAAVERTAAERKRDEVFTKWVLGTVVVFAGVYSLGPIADSLQGRIKAYPVSCTQLATGVCAEHAEPPTSYMVHVDQQIVVSLSEGAPAPAQLFNCVVADRRNWTCNIFPDKDSTRAVMREGDFSYAPPEPYPAYMRFTSRYQWWLARLNGK